MRLLFIFLIAGILSSCAYKHEEADLVIHNASIYTCDGEFHIHHAMAIKDGKIIEVGPDRQIRNKYDAEKEIDNGSRAIYPLFIDKGEPIKAFKEAMKEFDIQEGDDRKDALLTLTRFKARQEMMDDEVGSIEEGKKANFFTTNTDMMTIKWSLLDQVEVEDTYIEGKKQ